MAVVLSACERHYPQFRDRPLYTCCNLHFNRDGDASAANYENIGGTTIPLGTRVTVVSDHRNAIDFRAAIPSQQVFTLVFRFGRPRMTAAEYFGLVLVPDDPTPRLKTLEPSIAAAVREGRITAGMSKSDVLLARGSPVSSHGRRQRRPLDLLRIADGRGRGGLRGWAGHHGDTRRCTPAVVRAAAVSKSKVGGGER